MNWATQCGHWVTAVTMAWIMPYHIEVRISLSPWTQLSRVFPSAKELAAFIPLTRITLPSNVHWGPVVYSPQGSARSVFANVVALGICIHVWIFTYFLWYKFTILWCNMKSIFYTILIYLLVWLTLPYFNKKAKGDILKLAEILLIISCSSIIVKEWPPKDFHGGPVVQNLYFHCRRHGFHPWLGN